MRLKVLSASLIRVVAVEDTTVLADFSFHCQRQALCIVGTCQCQCGLSKSAQEGWLADHVGAILSQRSGSSIQMVMPPAS